MTRKIGGAMPPKAGDAAVPPPRPRSCLGARIGAYRERARLADELIGLARRDTIIEPPNGPRREPRFGIRIDA